jgi:hypothetical protein
MSRKLYAHVQRTTENASDILMPLQINDLVWINSIAYIIINLHDDHVFTKMKLKQPRCNNYTRVMESAQSVTCFHRNIIPIDTLLNILKYHQRDHQCDDVHNKQKKHPSKSSDEGWSF